MYRRTRPEVGHWYHDVDRELVFRIVAIDERSGFIALQHYDGELEEVDIDDFVTMALRDTGQPKDWRGPYEIEDDDELMHEFGEYAEFEAEHMRVVDYV